MILARRALAALAALAAVSAGGLAEAAPTLVVGQLTRQHVKECKKDGKIRWVAPHLQLGFVRVTAARGVKLDPLVGKTVAAWGKVSTTARPLRPLAALGNCPGAQMRGDWVEAKGGMRIRGPRPGSLGKVKLLHARRARAAKLLWLQRRGAGMRARVRNGLAVPLPKLTLHARYERCLGTRRQRQIGRAHV